MGGRDHSCDRCGEGGMNGGKCECEPWEYATEATDAMIDGILDGLATDGEFWTAPERYASDGQMYGYECGYKKAQEARASILAAAREQTSPPHGVGDDQQDSTPATANPEPSDERTDDQEGSGDESVLPTAVVRRSDLDALIDAIKAARFVLHTDMLQYDSDPEKYDPYGEGAEITGEVLVTLAKAVAPFAPDQVACSGCAHQSPLFGKASLIARRVDKELDID